MARFELPEWAKRKVGPFPVWAYGAVGGGVLIALFLRGHPFTAGSAPRAQIGAPGSSSGLGAGVGRGNLPLPALETSPPGSPQPPGRVSPITSPSRFISSFNPQRGYTNPGPVPNVGGHILGAGGVSLPDIMNQGGGFSTFNQADPGYQAYKFGEQNPLYTGLSSGWTPDSGFAAYRAGELSSGWTPDSGFAAYRAGERADLNYLPTSGFGPSLFDQALGPAVGGYSAGLGSQIFAPAVAGLDQAGNFSTPNYYAPADVIGGSTAVVSYAPSAAIQGDIAQSAPDYSVSGAVASAPSVGDVGPTSGGAGTTSVF